jgi:sugar O-acyltransferase (sialic acid O-acetyltransferase NeuD family)
MSPPPSTKVSDSPRRVFILGSGMWARELAVHFRLFWEGLEVFFVDDHLSAEDTIPVARYREVVGSVAQEARQAGDFSVMGTGKPHIRASMEKEILEPFLTFIHPQATVLGEVGPGTIVLPFSFVGPQAKLGKHVLVITNSTVGHDAVLEDLVVVSPNVTIGGATRLAKNVFVGMGASVHEGLTVGERVFIAMGAAVTKDVPPGVVAKGVPARW